MHHQAWHLCGDAGAFGRQDQAAWRGLTLQRQRQRQGAAHGPQFAGQRQFAGHLAGRQTCGVDQACRCQDAHRDGQVEAPGLLGQVGRRQVHRDALVVREGEAALLQRCAHTLARCCQGARGPRSRVGARCTAC
jgi:hypothetical protein